jgi:TIR domain
MGGTSNVEKLKVFLSHMTVESKLGDVLKQHLSHDFIGLVDVFISSGRTSILAGSPWLKDIKKALNEASLQIVLCSNESVSRPWINFEVGAAHLRGITIIPLCHSGLTPDQLPEPLGEFEGIVASSPDGMKKLYDRISQMLGSAVPNVDFQFYAGEVAAFETEYRQHRTDLAAGNCREQSTATILNPRVLCVSSRQFLKVAGSQLDVVLQAFPSAFPQESLCTAVSHGLLG